MDPQELFFYALLTSVQGVLLSCPGSSQLESSSGSFLLPVLLIVSPDTHPLLLQFLLLDAAASIPFIPVINSSLFSLLP